ncbi:MAG TPA: NAD-dependent epimerase/dehydratase family protein, partial [Chthonomonadaceae bacterium]|nr:NAD-dependent epimerase/dehydratase family protein [Chthonomonadaceae bacterium]
MEAAERILITGANGFAGRHLIAHLLAESPDSLLLAAAHEDHAPDLARREPGFPEAAGWPGGDAGGRVRVAGLDICDSGQVETLLQSFHPQQIVHLAARASGADADRDALFAVNVGGTRHLLEAAARLSSPPRVLLVSTGYVYGDTDPQRPAREEDPLASMGCCSPYTDSKLAMETLAAKFPEMSIVARAFAHTGPGQTPAFAVPAFARQLARIERGLDAPVLRVGNLEARRDLLDVRDVVRAYILLMRHGTPSQAYNIATGRPVPMLA